MGLAKSLVIFLPLLVLLLSNLEFSIAQNFKCNSRPTNPCNALAGYVTPNNTNLGAIQALFNVTDLNRLLGANNLPLSTPRSHNIPAKQVIKIPFSCDCNNDTGTSSANDTPIYTVQPDDGLFHIAAEVFSRLLMFQQIADANNIPDPNKIEVGQELKIPLPCSCDDVDGQKVVHYAHVVKPNSTLEQIAQEFGTNEQTLATLNGVTQETLKAEVALNVPLRACNSSVRSDSPDFPLLVSNGTYMDTANGCVRCMCDAANNWTLQCDLSQTNSSQRCPVPMQCQGGLSLGNSTTSSGCKSTCSYAGFDNSTIFTALVPDSTCTNSTASSPSNDGSRINLKNWGFLSILMLLSFHLFQ